MPDAARQKPDYGIDAPAVLRNFFLFGVLCVLAGVLVPRLVRLGPVTIAFRPMLFTTGVILLIEGLLYLYYVKAGKFRHRDFMLGMHAWTGAEQVLDVGCGRGLLLAGAAQRLDHGGHATGIDIWSNVDMGGNSAAATEHNFELEGIADRCTLVSVPAQAMPFADASFDVIVSNLCLHNIEDRAARAEALAQIVRILRPGGQLLISDYIRTAEYAAAFRAAGLATERRFGSWISTFPPLRVVVARKPGLAGETQP